MKNYSTSSVSKRNRFSLKFIGFLLLFVGLSVSEGWGQTNPTTGSLPYSFSGAATLPSTMAIHRFGTTSGAIPTTRTTNNGNADLPSTTTNNSGGYMIEGASGADGVSLLASGSQSAGAIIVEVSTTGKSNIIATWLSWTKLDQTTYTCSMALQYRVGESGTWIDVDSPSTSVYSTNSSTGRSNSTSFSQTLPAGADNQSIIQLRWIYWVSGGSSGSRDRLGIDEISITGSEISCSDPSTQASTVTFTNIASDQMTVGWTRGGTPGDGVIVVAKAGSVPDDPADGTSYTANAAFGSGTQIGAGTYVVYMGSGTSANITGLSASTTYHYKVYEKNCTGTSIMINTASPAENSQATTAACAVNPTITTTTAVSTITPTTASSGASGLSSGENCAITTRGVCWNTSANPTTANSKTTDGTGTTDFTSSLTSLSAQTLYYVRAYATNGFGTNYGPEVSFRTMSTELAAHPANFTATAASTSQINLTFSAASTITNADGYIILRRTGTNPTSLNIIDGVAPTSLSMPSGTTFLADINSTSTTIYNSTSLPNANTQYNYAIIAYNWDGVNPETYNYYTGGTIKVANATTLTQAITLPYTQDFEGTTTEWLLATTGTNKWAIGTATNNGGTKGLYISNDGGTSNAYSVTSTQTGTDAAIRVDLTGQTAASLSFDWKSNGEVLSGTVYDYGEVYINSGASDILISSTNEFNSSTTFASRNISLTAYVGGIITLKFRWVNDNTSGSQTPFAIDNISVTAGDFPTLTTTAASSTTANGTTSGGNITNDGGSSITARGVCYGTSSSPTIAGNKTSDGIGAGSFSSIINALTDNTTYYARAYATNSTGTSYGNEISFTTLSVAAPIANSSSSINSTGFTANWDAVTGASGGYLLDVSTNATFGTSASTTLNEGFESGLSTSGYANTNLNLTSGTWSFVDGGLENTSNYNSGTKGCQLKATTGSATSPSLNNVGILTFYAKSSGSSTFTIKKIVNGVTSVVTTKAVTTSWVQYSVPINDNNPDVQILILNGSVFSYIDDVSIGYTTATPSFVSGYNAKVITGQTTINSVASDLSPNTTYYYRIRAVGSNSTSANSNTTTVLTAPSAPTAAEETNNTATGFTATWALPTGGATSYALDVSENIGFSSFVSGYENLAVTGTSQVVSGLSPNTTYYYRVKAINATATATSGTITAATNNSIAVTGTVNVSTLPVCSTCDVVVAAGATLTVNENRTFNTMTVNPTGKLTNTASTLTLATLNLNSDATGTGTFVDNGTSIITAAHVQQYLTTGRNWYVSIPVTAADTTALSTSNAVKYWDEPTGLWKSPTVLALDVRKGYIAAGTKSTGVITFDGELNNGNVTFNATRTEGVYKEGFNLIGNPYPSYVNWESATKTRVGTSIWYRTKNSGGTYVFDTFNGVGTNNNQGGAVTGMIPPMQAVWVRVDVAQTTGSVLFTNAMRAHESGTNKLKAPAVNNPLQILRLQVSNVENSDEAIIVFNDNASNALDTYDSPKMTNSNNAIPEIYSLIGSDELVINGMNSYSSTTEIPVGFRTGATNNFSIKATEVSNFEDGTQIILKDSELTTETDITNGTPYTFASDAVSTPNRFSIIFRNSSITTGLDHNQSNDKSISVYRNSNSHIVVNCSSDIVGNGNVSVYNAIGQKLTYKAINSTSTVLEQSYTAGVYFVSVVANGKTITRKVIVD